MMQDSRSRVLVVQEKSGGFRGTGVWKFPTGVVDEGEDICDAAVREVKEETGWMPFEEYAAQPFIQKHDLLKKISEICAAKKEKREYAGFSPVATTTGFSQKKSYLYINSQCLNLED
ncbi:hypothetical protein SASPL_152720 [Salvia splendens]|uniref:Nudix hydrolase domain-containing protein n=1 Tax=Salvia splendens TaxID=180675 RepID=A0A8X8W3W0_SALSN|nr:hypothetical protein SASPL_152720 [Salvia splendens]